MKRLVLVFTIALAVITVLNVPGLSQSQDDTRKPAWEAVSVKPSPPGSTGSDLDTLAGGGLTAAGVTVDLFIQFAYGVRPYQISNEPKWVKSEHYDVFAKADASSAAHPSQVQLRLQALLADRFRLKLHRETQELPVYAMVIAKDGSKLKPSTSDSTGPSLHGGRGRVIATKVSIPAFVGFLSRTQVVTRPVIDKTGLTGSYDITLEWTPDEMSTSSGTEGQPGSNPDAPSIFTALQEQLGLKLESTKGPVEVLVIDRVERPTEN